MATKMNCTSDARHEMSPLYPPTGAWVMAHVIRCAQSEE